MSATTYIVLANAAVWLGLAGYLGFLALSASGLRRREQQVELLGDGHDG
ncbi:MAG: CcmD family protein [Pseudodesulfovibrio sp.]